MPSTAPGPDGRAYGQLTGRVAVVPGGAHGIGRAYPRRLAEEGARVGVPDIDGDGAVTTTSALAGDDLDFVGVNVDVADSDSVQWCLDEVDCRVGVAGTLVKNAAVCATVPMSRVGYQELSVDEWGFLMAVNLRGMWLMTRPFVLAMPQRGYSKVINVSSGTALKVSASRIHYVTSKAGILGFTKTLACGVGADGVAVNCIAPGSTLSEDVSDQDDDVLGRQSSAVSSRALPRGETPEDLVGTIVHFASPASEFVTGQTLVVHGGACITDAKAARRSRRTGGWTATRSA